VLVEGLEEDLVSDGLCTLQQHANAHLVHTLHCGAQTGCKLQSTGSGSGPDFGPKACLQDITGRSGTHGVSTPNWVQVAAAEAVVRLMYEEVARPSSTPEDLAKVRA
jgi:hypothetical protein